MHFNCILFPHLFTIYNLLPYNFCFVSKGHKQKLEFGETLPYLSRLYLNQAGSCHGWLNREKKTVQELSRWQNVNEIFYLRSPHTSHVTFPLPGWVAATCVCLMEFKQDNSTLAEPVLGVTSLPRTPNPAEQFTVHPGLWSGSGWDQMHEMVSEGENTWMNSLQTMCLHDNQTGTTSLTGGSTTGGKSLIEDDWAVGHPEKLVLLFQQTNTPLAGWDDERVCVFACLCLRVCVRGESTPVSTSREPAERGGVALVL